MTFVRFAAQREGGFEMAAWCDGRLAPRAPLVEAVADARAKRPPTQSAGALPRDGEDAHDVSEASVHAQ